MIKTFFVVFLIPVGGLIAFSLIFQAIFTASILPRTEKVGRWVGSFFVKRQASTLVLELIQILLPVGYIIILIRSFIDMDHNGPDLLLLFFTFISMLVLFINTSAILYIRTNHPHIKTPIISLIKVDNIERLRKVYFFNRLSIFFEEFYDFARVSSGYILSLGGLLLLRDNVNSFFLSLLLIPLYANYWVYYTGFFKVNSNKDRVFVRRVFMYLMLMVFFTYEQYVKYQSFISGKSITELEWLLLVFSGSAILYIALDRAAKEIAADYISFKAAVPNKTLNINDHEELLERFYRLINEEIEVDRILVYDYKPKSDSNVFGIIGLIVLSEKPCSTQDRHLFTDIIDRLSLQYGVSLNCMYFSKKDWENGEKVNPDLKKSIENKSIIYPNSGKE